jgi:hypothetical protein
MFLSLVWGFQCQVPFSDIAASFSILGQNGAGNPSASLWVILIPLFDLSDHPPVPTCYPKDAARNAGQGWPKATAEQRYERRSYP